MTGDDQKADRHRRFLALFAPIHDQARLSARRLCRSHFDGDDLFQEAALRALSRIDDLRDASRFRAWFYAVLLSVHRERSRRDFWRRCVPFLLPSAGEPRRDFEARPPPPAITPSFEETRGESARLSAALARLPVKQREAVVLFEVDGYTLEEVAEMQRDSISAVKSRLHRGRARLRQHYDALEPADSADLAASTLLSPRSSREVEHG